MAVHGYGFVYNEKSSDDFNVEVITVGYPDMHQDLGMHKEIIRDRPIHSSVDIVYGSRYSGNLEFPITLMKKDGLSFTNKEIRDVNRWLTSHKYPKRLEIISDVLDFENIYFNCLFTSVSTVSAMGIVALTYQVMCDAPYGYEDFSEVYVIDNASPDLVTEIAFNNTSDESEEYLYPTVRITKKGDGDVGISCLADTNNDIVLRDLKDGEVVIMNSLRQIISSTRQTFANTLGGYDNFNHNWLRLLYGNNIIGVHGNCTLEISGAYPRKVGI